MDFNKELLCKYISCSFELADSLQVKLVRQLKGRMRIDSVESHRLKRSSGSGFAKFRHCHAMFQVKLCNSLLGSLMKGAINKILKRARQTGYNNRDIITGHRKMMSTPWEDQSFIMMMCANKFLSSPMLRTKLIRCVGYHLSVHTITRHLLAVEYLSRRLAWCPILALVHRWRRGEWARHWCLYAGDRW